MASTLSSAAVATEEEEEEETMGDEEAAFADEDVVVSAPALNDSNSFVNFCVSQHEEEVEKYIFNKDGGKEEVEKYI